MAREVDVLQDLRASVLPLANTALTETTGTSVATSVEHNPHSAVGMPLYSRFAAARAAAADDTLRLAFHGTKAANIDSIFEHSLDPSRRGDHVGQKFGAGEYCASRLSTAINYCREDGVRVNKVVVLAVLAEGAKVHSAAEPWGEILVVARPEHLVPIAVIEVPFATASVVLARLSAGEGANRKRKLESEQSICSRILTSLRRGDVSDASELYNSTEEVREGGRPSYAFQVALQLEQDGLDRAVASALFPGALDAITAQRRCSGAAGPSTSLPSSRRLTGLPPAPVVHAPLVKMQPPPASSGRQGSVPRPTRATHSGAGGHTRWLYRQHFSAERASRRCEWARLLSSTGAVELAEGEWPAGTCDPVTLEELAARADDPVVRLPCHHCGGRVVCCFQRSTVERSLRLSGRCPSCRTPYDVPGPQPSGQMIVRRDGAMHCAGHPGVGTLVATFAFAPGVQTERPV